MELGAALAGEARRNLAGFGRVTVVNADFETWRPASPEAFGLVFAATAWHWIDPEIRYPKARELLKPGGHLAFWEAVHVFPDGGDPFFREIQDVYDEIGEGMPPGSGFAKPDDARRPARAEIDGERPVHRRDDPAVRLGDHVHRRRLHPPARHVLRAHRDGAVAAGPALRRDPPPPRRRPDGLVRRHWGAVLHVARKV